MQLSYDGMLYAGFYVHKASLGVPSESADIKNVTAEQLGLPGQRIARWLKLSTEWLRPIYEHIHTGVKPGGYV